MILVSAGGTGGGVYPAISVIEALRRVSPQTPVHFVGSHGGMESNLVSRDLVDAYHEVQSAPIHGISLRNAIPNAFKVLIGIVEAYQLVGKLKPSALFITGGWVTFPIAVACWLRRVPVAIFLPDIEPGLTIKLLSRIASVILTTTDGSAQYFPRGTTIVESGYPLRSALLTVQANPTKSRRKTILVTGGSRGARSINNAVIAIAPQLIADGYKVVHITGQLDHEAIKAQRDALPDNVRDGYVLHPYLNSSDMAQALANADLVVSRAGASVLGEYPYFSLPAILIPYPYAWRYQKINADHLESRGAAVRVNDENLGAELLPTIRDILSNTARLDTMRRAARSLRRDDAAGAIARHVLSLASPNAGKSR
jgi:UDP-N-acetylglucosamine--N-acetylmuramyl-(pentapeptide) pyrophosphoryl-undecaprenol N-acetylglucosamine transferase